MFLTRWSRSRPCPAWERAHPAPPGCAGIVPTWERGHPALGARASRPHARDAGILPHLGARASRPHARNARILPHLGARASRPRWEHASCLRPPREGGASSPYRGRFFGGACVPALVLGFRTPNLPLLLFVGAGGRGDEGQKRTGMQKTLHMWIVCAHSLSSVRTRL